MVLNIKPVLILGVFAVLFVHLNQKLKTIMLMKLPNLNTLETVLSVTNVIIQPVIPQVIVTAGIIFSAQEVPDSSNHGIIKPVQNNYLTAPLLYAAQNEIDLSVLTVHGAVFIDASYAIILEGPDKNIEIRAELNVQNRLKFDIVYALADTEALDPEYVPTSLNRYYFSFNIENINLENINELAGYLHKEDPLTSRGTLTTVQKTSGGNEGGTH
ncbi:MAG: hypothetical protein ACI8ZM_003610 [Crocinitomix sp.]